MQALAIPARYDSRTTHIDTKMNADFTLDNLQHFQARYDDFVGRLGKQRLKEFEYRFGHLKVGLRALQASRAELLRLTGQDFNIFSLLVFRPEQIEEIDPDLFEVGQQWASRAH